MEVLYHESKGLHLKGPGKVFQTLIEIWQYYPNNTGEWAQSSLEGGKCGYCGTPLEECNAIVCECGIEAYCGDDCKHSMEKMHKRECRMYKIMKNEKNVVNPPGKSVRFFFRVWSVLGITGISKIGGNRKGTSVKENNFPVDIENFVKKESPFENLQGGVKDLDRNADYDKNVRGLLEMILMSWSLVPETFSEGSQLQATNIFEEEVPPKEDRAQTIYHALITRTLGVNAINCFYYDEGAVTLSAAASVINHSCCKPTYTACVIQSKGQPPMYQLSPIVTSNVGTQEVLITYNQEKTTETTYNIRECNDCRKKKGLD